MENLKPRVCFHVSELLHSYLPIAENRICDPTEHIVGILKTFHPKRLISTVEWMSNRESPRLTLCLSSSSLKAGRKAFPVMPGNMVQTSQRHEQILR